MGKEEGTLQVMNSEIIITCAEGAIPPKIQTAEGLEISINGTMIKETTTVLPGDTVTCTCGELYSEGCTELNISNDGLKAMLRIKKGTMTYYDILDCPATEVLQPQTKKTTITESINKEYILERLKTEGIIQGVDSEAIEYVLSKQDGQWTTIASGISPQQGTDAYMQTLYASSDYSLPKADVLENIDYREKGTITTVDKDTLLVQKISAVPGQPGLTVTGSNILPAKVKDCILKAGKNTYASEDGMQVFAASDGQPQLQKKGVLHIVTVEPVYLVDGDVDLASGHIRFGGDIVIRGKVTESMEVHAERSVLVRGSVTGARIKAEGSVTIADNVINSRILAGTRQLFGFQIYPQLVELETTLVDILNAVRQITKNQATSRFGFILDLLVEKKFTDFPEQITRLSAALSVDQKSDFSPEALKAMDLFKHQLGEFGRFAYQELEDAVNLIRAGQALKTLVGVQSVQESDIKIKYCLNSYLEASGNVTVTGQGCLHTDITAHGSIEIKGTIRSGTIKAEQNIQVNTVGSPAAVETMIIVPATKTIRMHKVFENTTVNVGGHCFKFNQPRSRVKVFRCQDTGQIEMAPF